MQTNSKKLMAAVVWLALSGIGLAQAAVSTEPPVAPTEIETAVLVVDIVAIDGASQAFTADVFTRFRWTDPRLAEPGTGSRRLSLDKIWHPRMVIANQRNADIKLPEVVEVDADGRVTYRQRVLGDFSCPLDLADFPFDRQQLYVHVVSAGYTNEQVKFVPDLEESGRSERFSITDWEVSGLELVERPYTAPHSERLVPGVSLQFEVSRLARYYAGTIFATVSIIVTMAWLVFWIPPSNINPRISVSVTSMLSLIAYRFVAGQDLPRLPYLTTMDFFLLGAAVMVLLGLASVVLISRSQSHGKEESALRWNKILRWTYPIAFGLMLLALKLV